MTEKGNETMSYAEYISGFELKLSIKTLLKNLTIPIDQIRLDENFNEENLFLRKWDIEMFGYAKGETPQMSKLWFDNEQKQLVEATYMN
jgi:hypothetical protein